jgi:hypothetical protein
MARYFSSPRSQAPFADPLIVDIVNTNQYVY